MPVGLDDRDIKILQILSREGRISKTALARRVNLSATPCWERLKRLEAAGLIRGYRAEVALERLGPAVTIFVVVEIENHRSADFAAFERAVQAEPRITGCWSIGGGYDYLLQIIARDIDGYQRLMDGMLAREVGVKRYFTYVVMKAVKDAAPPLDLLFGAKD
jgi:Lrp/AsnC family transcriptional regulator of ectoine degradation